MNRAPLYAALVLTALLLALHLFALHTFFYWYHRWFDIPVHVLGGAAVGSFLLAFIRPQQSPWLYFGGMLAVTVVWEIFEYAAGISVGQPHYWLDTSKDIIDGMIGASITFIGVKKILWHSH